MAGLSGMPVQSIAAVKGLITNQAESSLRVTTLSVFSHYLASSK